MPRGILNQSFPCDTTIFEHMSQWFVLNFVLPIYMENFIIICLK